MQTNYFSQKNVFPSGQLKCHRCKVCNGYGCHGNLPGLGGVFQNKNFQLNFEGWNLLRNSAESNHFLEKISDLIVTPKNLRCGPVTGAVENIGFSEEKDFYYPYLKGSADSGIGLCIGDGCPDEKLDLGIAAVSTIKNQFSHISTDTENSRVSAAFFLKPYPQPELFNRLEKVKPFADYAGIDIDSYNILTMRNLVHLEKKSALQLEEFRKKAEVPFVIKGVFTQDDIELVRIVKPDVIYISNHGGRVETRIGSTAEFLEHHGAELKNYCDEIWIDGGIRTKSDVQTALFYGADQVILARPLIRSVFDDGKNGISQYIKKLI